jgi:hypothetical protein
MNTSDSQQAGNKMTSQDAARIQSAEATKSGATGGVEKGSFAARAQCAAAKNEGTAGGQAGQK